MKQDKTKWNIAWLAFILIAALVLSACSANKSAKSESYAAPAAEAPMAAPMMMEEPAMDMAYTEEAAMMDTGAAAAQTSAGGLGGEELSQANYGGRKIIRTISLELRTDDFDANLAQILKDLETAGGYVQSSYVYGTKPEVVGDSGRNASYTLRLPVEQADAFVKSVSGYGTLISQNEDTQDVTDNYFDTETRLSVYRTTLERLKSILRTSESMEDIVALEREIADVTIQIEDLTTKLRKYDGMIQYATVNVQLYEERIKVGPAAKTPFGERVSDGFRETLSDTGNFLEDLAVLLLAGSPVILLLVVVALIVVWIVKKVRGKNPPSGPRMSGKEKRAARKAERLAKKQGLPVQEKESTGENKNEKE